MDGELACSICNVLNAQPPDRGAKGDRVHAFVALSSTLLTDCLLLSSFLHGCCVYSLKGERMNLWKKQLARLCWLCLQSVVFVVTLCWLCLQSRLDRRLLFIDFVHVTQGLSKWTVVSSYHCDGMVNSVYYLLHSGLAVWILDWDFFEETIV